MNQADLKNINGTKYVEVSNEPLHVEVYRNEFLRAYVATIPPGISTLYHRHSEDTVYIVIEGGTLATKSFKGYSRIPMHFPKSFGVHKMLMMGIQNAVTQSAALPNGLFFCLLNRQQDSVHKAAASCKNLKDMRLMGVEITENSRNCIPITLNYSHYKKELETDRFTVFAFKLKPGIATGEHSFNFPFFIVCINGLASIEIVASDISVMEKSVLKKGEFISKKGATKINIRNEKNKSLEMLVIALKIF